MAFEDVDFAGRLLDTNHFPLLVVTTPVALTPRALAARARLHNLKRIAMECLKTVNETRKIQNQNGYGLPHNLLGRPKPADLSHVITPGDLSRRGGITKQSKAKKKEYRGGALVLPIRRARLQELVERWANGVETTEGA